MQQSDHGLTTDQCRSLRCLAELMIPASTEYQVPSAGDEAIFGEILRGIGRDAEHVRQVVQRLDELSGGVFSDLEAPQRHAVATRLRDSGGKALTILSRIILQCYYRDDRVMQSLQMERRPPFPTGFQVEQGDWSLLDPVRARQPFYRRVK